MHKKIVFSFLLSFLFASVLAQNTLLDSILGLHGQSLALAGLVSQGTVQHEFGSMKLQAMPTTGFYGAYSFYYALNQKISLVGTCKAGMLPYVAYKYADEITLNGQNYLLTDSNIDRKPFYGLALTCMFKKSIARKWAVNFCAGIEINRVYIAGRVISGTVGFSPPNYIPPKFEENLNSNARFNFQISAGFCKLLIDKNLLKLNFIYTLATQNLYNSRYTFMNPNNTASSVGEYTSGASYLGLEIGYVFIKKR